MFFRSQGGGPGPPGPPLGCAPECDRITCTVGRHRHVRRQRGDGGRRPPVVKSAGDVTSPKKYDISITLYFFTGIEISHFKHVQNKVAEIRGAGM